MNPEEYRATREKLGLTQAGLAARLLGSEARRTTIVKREAGLQEITEEMALALRALKPSKTKAAKPGKPNNYLTWQVVDERRDARLQGPA